MSTVARRSIATGALAAWLAMGLCAQPAAAEQADARAQVTARVNAMARADLASGPTRLEISAADIARGFVEVREPQQLFITSNSRAGVMVEFHTLLPIFTGMAVNGCGDNVQLSAEGGAVAVRVPSPRDLPLAISYRFMLSPGVQPGSYAWPVSLAVQPL